VRDEITWAVRHVLESPTRLRYLLGAGLGTPLHLTTFLRSIVPRAARALAEIRVLAEIIPDDRLRHEALASIDGKAFHVAGAAILATFLPSAAADHYIHIVVPLETIYDYLDNLCDRHPEVAPDAYAVLHQAIADALDPSAPTRNYYAKGPFGDDGDYLHRLVVRTQQALRRLADHDLLLERFREAATLYGEMQTYKHHPAGERERLLTSWFELHRARFPTLEWQEFASAAGSQFQVYAPLYLLFAGRIDALDRCYEAYFPAVAALHVLLDSFVDRDEDAAHAELNFASVYGDPAILRERAAHLANSARRAFATLPDAKVHGFVLRVMTLFYLTHPNVYAQQLDAQALALLRAIG